MTCIGCFGRGGGGGGDCTCHLTAGNGITVDGADGNYTVSVNIPELVSPRTPNALEVDTTGKLRVLPGALDCAAVVACVTGSAAMFGCGLVADPTGQTISVKIKDDSGIECTSPDGLAVKLDPAGDNALTVGQDGLKVVVPPQTTDCNAVVTCITSRPALFGCGLSVDSQAQTISAKTNPSGGLDCDTNGLYVKRDPASDNALTVGSAGVKVVVPPAPTPASFISSDAPNAIVTGADGKLKVTPYVLNCTDVVACVTGTASMIGCGLVADSTAKTLGVKADPDGGIECTGNGIRLKKDPVSNNILQVTSAGVSVVLPALDCNAVLDCVIARFDDSMTFTGTGSSRLIGLKRDPAADNILTISPAGVKVAATPVDPASLISADTPNALITGSDGKLRVPAGTLDCNAVMDCIATHLADTNSGLDVTARKLSVKRDPATGNVLTITDQGLAVTCADIVTCVGNNLGNGLEAAAGKIQVKRDPASDNAITVSSAGVKVVVPPAPTPASFISSDAPNAIVTGADGKLKVVIPALDCNQVATCVTSTPSLIGCGLSADSTAKSLSVKTKADGGLTCTTADGLAIKLNSLVPNILHINSDGIYAGCSDIMFCVRSSLDPAGGLGPSGTEQIKILLDPAAGNLLKTTSAGAAVSCADVVTCVGANLGDGLELAAGKIKAKISTAAGNTITNGPAGLYVPALDCAAVITCIQNNLMASSGLQVSGGKLGVLVDPAAGNLLTTSATGLKVTQPANLALFVAASNASTREKARADYQCDGTADDVEIQAALDQIKAGGGGTVTLSTGMFNLASPVLVQGNDDVNFVHDIAMVGQGPGSTRLSAANGLAYGVWLGKCVRAHLRDFGVEVRGATHGIASVATRTAAASYRSFYLSTFKNLEIVGPYDGVATGWGMHLGSPWESVFENINIKGTRNGLRMFSEDPNQNPGDCVVTRMMCDLYGNNAIAYQIDSPTGAGNMNQNEFVMCEAYLNQTPSASTGGTGILISGPGEPASNHFRGINVEQFDKILDLQAGVSNTFRFNYVTMRSGATGLTALNFGTSAWNNRVLSVGMLYMNANGLAYADNNTEQPSFPNELHAMRVSLAAGVTSATGTVNPAKTTVRSQIYCLSSAGATLRRYGPVIAAPNAVQTLTDAATVAVDASLGDHFRLTLAGNRTLGIPTNPTDGQKIILEVTQDGTGNRTLSPTTTGAGCWALGSDITSLTLSTAAGKIDMIGAVYSAAAAAGAGRWLITSLVRGF